MLLCSENKRASSHSAGDVTARKELDKLRPMLTSPSLVVQMLIEIAVHPNIVNVNIQIYIQHSQTLF